MNNTLHLTSRVMPSRGFQKWAPLNVKEAMESVACCLEYIELLDLGHIHAVEQHREK